MPRTTHLLGSTQASNHRLLPFIYASVFIASLGFGATIYFIPVFAQSLGASYLDLGIIGTVRSVPYAFLPLFVGHLADKLNRARLYMLSIAFNALATGSLVVARSVYDIVLIQSVQGVGFALFWPSSETLISEIAPAEKRVQAFGRYSVAWASGFLLGPLVGGVITEAMGFVPLFLASSLVLIVSLAGGMLTIAPRYHAPINAQGGKVALDFQVVSQLFPVYLALIPYSVSFAIIVAIFPGYANNMGLTVWEIGVLGGVFGVARTLIFYFAEQFLKLGEKKAITLAALGLALAHLTIAMSTGFPGLALASALAGLSLGIIFPLTINFVSQQFPRERLGVAIGSYETVFGIGFAIGPVFAGFMAEAMTANAPFYALAGLSLTMILLVSKWKMHSS